MDIETSRLGFRSLDLEVIKGMKLAFTLSVPGLKVDEPVQILVWRGRTEAVQFGVTVPDHQKAGSVIGNVVVTHDSVPLGRITFKIVVEPLSAEKKATIAQPVGDEVKRYTMAFVSYASDDRAKVLARIQMLRLFGIKYFQDVLHLEPGDRWERELYRHIDNCDLFLLFWSSAARDSEWVLKEVRYALARKGGDDFAPPEIFPIIIEGPPIVPPPPDLKHLHFNDPLIYFASDI
jgi:hypothetical protein